MLKEKQSQLNYIESLEDQINYPKKDNEFLKHDIIHKNTIIECLVGEIRKTPKSKEGFLDRCCISPSLSSSDTDFRNCSSQLNSNDGWPSVDKGTANKRSLEKNSTENIQSLNNYRTLIVDDSNFDNEVATYVPGPITLQSRENNISGKRHPNIINKYPEHDNIHHTKTVHGNSTYADISKQGKKVCIFSDSICKPIDMVEFSYYCKHKSAIKRSFPGATASQLKHFVKPTLIENTPDIAIIHIGTNNLTKKAHQSADENFNEIM